MDRRSDFDFSFSDLSRSPEEVARCRRLDRRRKVALLRRQLEHELALQAADDDGMGGGRPPRACEVADALADVLEEDGGPAVD